MARRTKAELIAEIDRLYDCMEEMIDSFDDVLPMDMAPGPDKSDLIARESYHAAVAARKCTASEAARGLQEGVNDLSGGLSELLEQAPDLGKAVLHRYRTRTGRDYWADAGDPRKTLRAVLDRGEIADDSEFRLLNDHVSVLDNTTLDDTDRTRAGSLLLAYEQGARPETD